MLYLVVKKLNPVKKDKNPRIFISHSWKYHRDYVKLKKILKNEGLKYYDHSISEIKADNSMTTKQIENRIRRHLFYSRCLLVFTGKDTGRNWIKKEILYAGKLRKKIIVVKGNGVNFIPNYLQSRAHDIVPFEKNSIIKSILEN